VSARFVIRCARKDLARRLGDPLALVLWILIPVTIGGLMTVVSGGGGGPSVRLLLVDQDDTFLGDLLEGSSERGATGGFLAVEAVELEQGRARIEAGDASGLLILPEGFTEAVLEERPATVTLITNPAQRIAPAILEQGVELLSEGQFYLQRLLGEPLRELAQGPPSGADFFADERMAELSAEINRRMRQLDDVLFPPVLELATETAEEEEPLDLARMFLPGILFMSLLFIAQGMSEDLWKEKELGTLRRVVSAPRSLASFLGGKVLAGAALMAAVALAGLLISVLGYGQSALALVWGLPWCTFAGGALLVLFSLVQLLASSRRAGNVLTSVVLFPLMMIGGCFFPFEAMPRWMRAVGSRTPNGQAVLHLKAMYAGHLDLIALGGAALAIGAGASVCFLLCLRLLRRRLLAA
jgi:ABC-type multidrug transport system permease subunit